jgi:hypothetical protein
MHVYFIKILLNENCINDIYYLKGAFVIGQNLNGIVNCCYCFMMFCVSYAIFKIKICYLFSTMVYLHVLSSINKDIIIYPHNEVVRRYTGISLSVRPSGRLPDRPSVGFFLWGSFDPHSSYLNCRWSLLILMSPGQKSRSQGAWLRKACPPNDLRFLWPTVCIFGMVVGYDHYMTPIDFKSPGQMSRSQGPWLKKDCPPNNLRFFWPTVFIFGMEVSHNH